MLSPIEQAVCEYLIHNQVAIKIIVVGNMKIGKTQLIAKYIKNKRLDEYIHLYSQSSISEVSTMTKEKGAFEIRDIESFINMYKEELQDGGYPVEVEIWDTVGQEKYDEKYLYDQKYN